MRLKRVFWKYVYGECGKEMLKEMSEHTKHLFSCFNIMGVTVGFGVLYRKTAFQCSESQISKSLCSQMYNKKLIILASVFFIYLQINAYFELIF